MLVVRAPVQAHLVGLAVLGHLTGGFLAVGALHPDFELAGLVAQVGHVLAVGRPAGRQLADAGRGGQVANVALFGRHSEDVAPGAKGDPVCVGGQVATTHVVAHLLDRRAGQHVVAAQRYGHLAGLLGFQIQHVQPAAVFIHDGIRALAGKLHIVFVVLGDLAVGLGGRIVGPDLQAAGLITGVVDRFALPHGEVVAADPFGHVFRGVGLEIVDPDVLGHATLVAFPGAALTADAIVGDLFAVRRVARQTAGGQDHPLGQAAVRRNGEQLLVASGAALASGLETHSLATGLPVDHAVEAGVPGQAIGLAADGGHGVDIVVAVVVAGKRDGGAVRAELGLALESHRSGKPAGLASLGRNGPQVTRIGEDDRVAMDVGVPQQAHVVGVGVSHHGVRGLNHGRAKDGQKDCQDRPHGMAGFW